MKEETFELVGFFLLLVIFQCRGLLVYVQVTRHDAEHLTIVHFHLFSFRRIVSSHNYAHSIFCMLHYPTVATLCYKVSYYYYILFVPSLMA